ncbi:MAG: ABC transporter ATP-binding protein [Anaerolineae bacterium]
MIQVRQVSKLFQKRDGETFEALRRVEFAVEDDEFVSIIGPSGCGKTTLLKMIDGLVKPSEGEVLINGRAVRRPGPDRAIVFQNFVLLPWADVLTNIAFGLEVRGIGRRERGEIARAQLERMGLAGFEHHYPHELSGGMQQRVGLARALAVNPDILLMDEPFGSLDAQTRQLMQSDLLRIWQEERKTVVFITHSMDEAAYLSDRVLIMDTQPGRIKEVMDIPLPRPRDDSVRRSALFTELTAHMWDELRAIIAKDAEGRQGVR